MSLLALLSPLTTRGSSLHPLNTALPEAELHLTLRNAARANEEVVVECDYKPRRERDVRKARTLHLLDSVWRIGSRDVLSVSREEARRVMQAVRAVDTTITVTIPLHHPDPAYHAYQLASVRVGDVQFERWFTEAPSLDPGFGLTCLDAALSGTVRPGGLGAAPLGGTLPLWPSLREVDLTIGAISAPVIRLWDPQTKHHWDGWRKSVPEAWHGGSTMVARHIDTTTNWRTHEYHAIQPANAPAVSRPKPPAGVLPGLGLEVFWPKGDAIDFPDVRFERPVSVTPVRLARLAPRARELLARSVESRPGCEPNSLSAAEWEELEPLLDDDAEAPLKFAMRTTNEGNGVMTAQRVALNEPWLYFFAVDYDSDRRFAVNVMLFTPSAWSGPHPD